MAVTLDEAYECLGGPYDGSYLRRLGRERSYRRLIWRQGHYELWQRNLIGADQFIGANSYENVWWWIQED